MTKLTANQLTALADLANHSQIDHTSMSFHTGGGVHFQVSSKLDANYGEILNLLSDTFCIIDIDEKPWQTVRDDGTSSDLFGIEVDGVSVFNLHMNFTTIEKAPADTEAGEKIKLANINTDRWLLEDIMRQEG